MFSRFDEQPEQGRRKDFHEIPRRKRYFFNNEHSWYPQYIPDTGPQQGGLFPSGANPEKKICPKKQKKKKIGDVETPRK